MQNVISAARCTSCGHLLLGDAHVVPADEPAARAAVEDAHAGDERHRPPAGADYRA